MDTSKPCVATIGFFDGVHRGHRFLIDQVKNLATERGLASTLITFAEHPRKVMRADFQPTLLTTPAEKESLLRSTGVDRCEVLHFTPELSCLSACEFMSQVLKQQLHVQILVIGYDHRFGHNRSEGFDEYCSYGRELGIEVMKAEACTLDGLLDISSSVIRAFLHEGEVEAATRCLGYPYFLEGRVVDGYKVGRTLGFPTANLCVEHPDKLVPAQGVYAVKVTVEGKSYKGMLNIGNRPTLDNGGRQSIEVHILNFSSDIYRQTVRVELVKRLRGECKFASLEALTAQLALDAKEAECSLSCN